MTDPCVLNFVDIDGETHSLIGTIQREGGYLLLLAKYDVADMERLIPQVVHLNEELAQVQRKLARQARDLRELSVTDSLKGASEPLSSGRICPPGAVAVAAARR